MDGFTLGQSDPLTPELTQICTDGQLSSHADQATTPASGDDSGSESGSDSESETNHDEHKVKQVTESEVNQLTGYYKSLTPERIEEDVKIMQIATKRELFQLITTDCNHYISIIEHYKRLNLQTLFNITIRRIENHLLIKFRLRSDDRWVEVGFFDDDNTDKETLVALRQSIEYYLKTYELEGQDRRKHVASQFDSTAQIKDVSRMPVKKALPDDYFNSRDNPELAISKEHLESAGYTSVPPQLKEKEQALRNAQYIAPDQQVPETEANSDTDRRPDFTFMPEAAGQLNQALVPGRVHVQSRLQPLQQSSITLTSNSPKRILDPMQSCMSPVPLSAADKKRLNLQSLNALLNYESTVDTGVQVSMQNYLDDLDDYEVVRKVISLFMNQLKTAPLKYHPFIHYHINEHMRRLSPHQQTAVLLGLAD